MPLWIRLFSKFWGVICFSMPTSFRRWIGKSIAWLWWDVFRIRRFTVYRGLTIAFPDLSKQERQRIAKASLVHMGSNLLEFLSLPSVDREWMENHVVFDGWENYEEARSQGRGLFFLSMHMGNGDFGCAMMVMKGIPLHLISKKFKSRALNDFWFGVRESMGTRFMDPHSPKTAFEILGACKRREPVTFVLDQFMGRPYGIQTDFFGKKTGTAYGLALFAIKTKAPVVPVYTYHDDQGKTHVVFGKKIEVAAENGNRDLQILETTQRYNAWIESVICLHPEQWMWIHRRWKMWE
jgi:Kdo2-lipid IVA lauroyltransferase/acyltransferase